MGVTARWTPIRVVADGHSSTVDWCRTDGVAFDDPFLDQSMEAALRHPARLLFRRRTPLVDLLRPAPERTVPIVGVVLHLSRCGSTLLTRLLGDVPGVLALSEPAVVDTVLRLPADQLGIREADRPALVRGALAALAQADAGEQGCVVKLDAWAALQLPVLRQALADVPWVFVSRDAVEVLVSHRGHRGYHLLPGTLDPGLLGVDPWAEAPGDLDAYGAAVLGRIAASVEALGDDGGRGLVVDYVQLPDAVEDVARHFGLEVDDGTRARWAARAALDAKNPVLEHLDDRAAKQAAADDHLREVAARWADRPVRALQDRAGLEVAR
jgi:hypothetical protein